MNTTTRISTAERLGRSLGRGWRASARGERRVSNWLVSKGLPVVWAAALLWVVKLAVLGALLYVAFWLALLLVFGMAAAWVARNTPPEDDEEKLEWRVGHSGFGLYDKNEWRRDMGDWD
jgi:fatty acid desaturase